MSKMAEEAKASRGVGALDTDALMQELGQFRRFHVLNYGLLGLVPFALAHYAINYVFLAADVPYRCVVPECESANSTEYSPAWLEGALAGGGRERRCASRAPLDAQLPCEAGAFSEELRPCDRWLYASHDTIVAEFNLACQEWKRTLVGTIHNVGMLVSLPILGYISDRWGRKRALVLSCTLVGAIGTLKAFSVSYEMYVIVEFLETVAGASAFPAAYILTIELLGQDKRVLTTAFLGIMLVIGGLSFALLAKAFPYFRTFILVAYPPSLLFLSYIYFLPESIRWLLSKGRKEEALEIIMKAAKMNKVTLSDETIRQLTSVEEKVNVDEKKESVEEGGLWIQVLRSPIIMTRLAICSWWWITCTFVFYGLAINSVSLAGDKYTNYMLVVSVEIIAVVANALVLDRIGRKTTLLIAYLVCGFSCVAITFVPTTLSWLSTLLYLVGKVAITQAFSGIYMYTSELFPTHARHSLLGFCSMIGRLGSIIAPQMPLLAIYIEWLPSVLFGATALVAGGLMLTTPETLNTRLPDTIKEAECLASQPRTDKLMYVLRQSLGFSFHTSRCFQVKQNISQIRGNTTHSIWAMTNKVSYLNQSNWTAEVVDMLKDFENAILLEMKVRGWDGNESTEDIQWTFYGALFYSIIVITTIGYGHIAPKTQAGKVVTIFYAILGIPLMLLCLSNIGDVMASSFRFLYWRVCCYVCTRPPKQAHRHTRRSNRAGSTMGSTRRRRPLERSYSDNDFRYRDSGYNSNRPRRSRPGPPVASPGPSRTRSQPPAQARPYGLRDFEEDRSPVRHERYGRDHYEDEEEEFPKISLPLKDLQAALKDLEDHQTKSSKPEIRSKSLPRPSKTKPEFGPKRDFDDSRYFEADDGREMYEMHDLFDVDYANYKERKALEERERRKRERDDYRLRDRGYDPEDEDYEFDIPRSRRSGNNRRHDRGRSEYYERDFEDLPVDRRRGRRAKSAIYENDRRWDEWDEDRDVERGRRRLRRLQTVDDTPHLRPPYRYSPSPDRDDWSDEPPPIRHARSAAWGSRQSDIYAIQGSVKEEIKPVPIWLCVFLVASYIVMGTFLFKRWEGWAYLDAAYFCFITLTTIGFGDFVPAQGQSGSAADAVHSIALCSLYLLFGIALLAMSFNLVQEEVRANVAAVATRLGIIKPRDHVED